MQFAIQQLSTQVFNPTSESKRAVKHLIRYLKGRHNTCLRLEPLVTQIGPAQPMPATDINQSQFCANFWEETVGTNRRDQCGVNGELSAIEECPSSPGPERTGWWRRGHLPPGTPLEQRFRQRSRDWPKHLRGGGQGRRVDGHTGRYEKTRARAATSGGEEAYGKVEEGTVRRAKTARPRREVQQTGPIANA